MNSSWMMTYQVCQNGTKFLQLPSTSTVFYWALYPNGSYTAFYDDGTSLYFPYQPINTTQISLQVLSPRGQPSQFGVFWSPDYMSEISAVYGSTMIPYTAFFYLNNTWTICDSTPIISYYQQMSLYSSPFYWNMNDMVLTDLNNPSSVVGEAFSG